MTALDSEPPQPVFLALSLLPAVLGALFVYATATLNSLSGARRSALRDNLTGRHQAAIVRYIESEPFVQARWLVWRAFCVATTAALVTYLFRNLGLWSVGVGLLASALSHAIPAELIRHFGKRRAEQVAPSLLLWLRPLEMLASPLADPLAAAATAWAGMHPLRRSPTASITESEVEQIVNEGELNGSLAHDQSEMIRNVLDFGDVTAGEVMVPRTRVDALDERLPLEQVLRLVAETQHSRYPVYRERIDNVVGILHVKDLFSAMTAEDRPENIKDLLRTPVAFIPESQPASTVLKDMRAGRHHLAVVIDEFGGFSGIVSLEDLLEEIVGDIRDEHDLEEEPTMVEISEGRLLVDASLPISDLNRRFGTELPDDQDYVSIGGLLVEQLGRVPVPGARHEANGVTFVVRDADERHVERVEIHLPGSARGNDAPSSDAA